MNDQNFEWVLISLLYLKFHFVAAFDTANMHVECVTGINRILYYWFQWHTHSTPCSFAISFVKYSLLSSNCLPCIPMLFIIISYLGSELERDSTESLCNSPSQELHCHILPIHTQIQLDFTHLQVCIMSIHLPNNIVQVCVNDVVSSNCNALSWLNVYILLHGCMYFIDEWVA